MTKDPACFEDAEAQPLIERLCEKHQIDQRLLRDLCAAVDQYAGSGRPKGMTGDIADAIDSFIGRSSGGRPPQP